MDISIGRDEPIRIMQSQIKDLLGVEQRESQNGKANFPGRPPYIDYDEWKRLERWRLFDVFSFFFSLLVLRMDIPIFSEVWLLHLDDVLIFSSFFL